MKQLQDLLETGVYQEYVPPKATTVRDWLVELNLNQIFTVLVNGKKADLDLKIGPKDKVVIIPQIAGGLDEDIKNKFGLDPENIGLRHRGYWIVKEIEDEEENAGAEIGDLCIKARDGGYNSIDNNAFNYSNFRGTTQDFFDSTYRYYYYKPLGSKK